jgi:hypothetical protein
LKRLSLLHLKHNLIFLKHTKLFHFSQGVYFFFFLPIKFRSFPRSVVTIFKCLVYSNIHTTLPK